MGFSIMDRVANIQIGDLCGVTKGWLKGLVEVFFDSPTIPKEWEMIGLVKGYMRGSVWEVVR